VGKSKLGAAVFLALVLLFACTPAGGGDENPSDVTVALPADNPGDIELRNQLAKQFMEENPDIDVKVQVIPSNGYNEKIFTAVAAGNPPDIFNSGDIVIPTIVNKNYALDLTEFIEKDGYNTSAFYPETTGIPR
jgi:raffinose/stachyose/melibiose transport system substrate-binding protein